MSNQEVPCPPNNYDIPTHEQGLEMGTVESPPRQLDSAALASSNGDPLQEYRMLHQQNYEQRLIAEEEAARRRSTEDSERIDKELANQLNAEENRRNETWLAADEEYSRQLYEQLNDTILPEAQVRLPVPVEEDDSIRAPMRTGYAERLIDSPVFGTRNDRSERLLQDESPDNATQSVFGWFDEWLSDEDRTTTRRQGPFGCSQRLLVIFFVVCSLLLFLFALRAHINS